MREPAIVTILYLGGGDGQRVSFLCLRGAKIANRSGVSLSLGFVFCFFVRVLQEAWSIFLSSRTFLGEIRGGKEDQRGEGGGGGGGGKAYSFTSAKLPGRT